MEGESWCCEAKQIILTRMWKNEWTTHSDSDPSISFSQELICIEYGCKRSIDYFWGHGRVGQKQARTECFVSFFGICKRKVLVSLLKIHAIRLPFSGTFVRSAMITFNSPRRSVATWRISYQSFRMSSPVVLVEVTVNRITYFPFRDAGTQWIFPRWFKRFNSFSVSSLSPLMRKTTSPRYLFAGTSNRWSAEIRASNFCAKRTPSLMCFWSPLMPNERNTNHNFRDRNLFERGICQCM